MIFVAFLLPVAVYLLLLAAINRRPRPVVVSGTWDFIGLLFASSGFLLVGGPAILSSLSETWRTFWLLGEGHPLRDTLLSNSALWLLLPAAYFVVVLAGCFKLWGRYRQMTSIYNVEPAAVEGLLAEICDQLGLGPIRSGNLLVFGLPAEVPSPRGAARREAIQAPHSPNLGQPAAPAPPEPAGELVAGQSALLELEPFAALKHVTLRWGPHDSPVRHAVEAELEHRLAHVEAPDHDTAAWMSMAAWAILCLCLGGLLMLAVRAVVGR